MIQGEIYSLRTSFNSVLLEWCLLTEVVIMKKPQATKKST